ncbi:MAG TPA: HIRAN domain-containing protein [Solirubrobacteraceae bacterium]|nr:HIRAN domain-containing protein [Solirubrobacteraceae bacterium]
MGLLDRLRPASAPDAQFTVRVYAERRTFRGAKGDELYSDGQVPVDGSGRPLGETEHRTSDQRVYHCRVSGTHHYPSALGDPRFGNGSRVTFRAEPGNPTDPNAVAIWDAGGTVQVGYVPASLSRTVAAAARNGRLQGQVVRELRLGSASGKRLALYVLIAPPGRIVTTES